MMKWYTDSFAQEQHRRMAEHLKPMIAQLLGPTYELTHLGIHKNDISGEVILKLHLNPIGRISVASDPLQIEDRS